MYDRGAGGGEGFLARQARHAAKAAAKRCDDAGRRRAAADHRDVDLGDSKPCSSPRGRAADSPFHPTVTSRADRHPRRSDDDLSRLDAIRRKLAAEKASAKQEKKLKHDETFSPRSAVLSADYAHVPPRVFAASRRDREVAHHVKDELDGCTFEPRLAASCPAWIHVMADQSRKRRGPKPKPQKAWM